MPRRPDLSVRLTQGARSLARVSGRRSKGSLTTLQTRSVVDDLRSGKTTCGFCGDGLAHLRQRWLQLLGRSTPRAVGDWDAESTLPSSFQRGAPVEILEEVETAGVFSPCHGDEQPRDPASLNMCLAGWSICP